MIVKGEMIVEEITPEKAMKELTMVLMYLSKFSEKNRFSSSKDITWKGYSFDVINELDKDEFIYQSSHRSKSVKITEEGIKFAQKLMEKYNIEDWK